MVSVRYWPTMGSSPQARSGRPQHPAEAGRGGLISAGAERTTTRVRLVQCRWAHLRRRGADRCRGCGRPVCAGSSPQARSGLSGEADTCHPDGLISAGAERTCRGNSRPELHRAHLRRRGADTPTNPKPENSVGSSPQARSGHEKGANPRERGGLISAGAERTPCRSTPASPTRAHLRRRGADPMGLFGILGTAGSSPQARSGRSTRTSTAALSGLISAGAERTSPRRGRRRTDRAHLRRRGADRPAASRAVLNQGSSPQARSGPSGRWDGPIGGGLISAGAERTYAVIVVTPVNGAHLRRRGADITLTGTNAHPVGSSPQARSGPTTTTLR